MPYFGEPYAAPVKFRLGFPANDFTLLRAVSGTVLAAGTSVAIDAPGVAAGDDVFATIMDGNSSGVGIVSAVATTDTVTVTLSGTPGADSVVKALILRTAA